MDRLNPTLQDLQRFSTKPYVHGNGFILLRTPRGNRYHFWGHPGIPRQSVSTPIHDHVWGFRSTVVCGRLVNIRYALRPASEHIIDGPLYRQYTTEAGDGENTALIPAVPDSELCANDLVRLEVSGINMVQKGQQYHMNSLQFHETYVAEPTVTFLEKTSPRVRTTCGFILVPHGREPDNTFDRHACSEQRLWNIIEEILVYGHIAKTEG